MFQILVNCTHITCMYLQIITNSYWVKSLQLKANIVILLKKIFIEFQYNDFFLKAWCMNNIDKKITIHQKKSLYGCEVKYNYQDFKTKDNF